MVVTLVCARSHAHSRSTWAENIADAWLPVRTYGKHSRGHNFNSKAWIKKNWLHILKFTSILHPHIKLWPESFPCLHSTDFFSTFSRDRHTKQEKKSSRNHHRVVTFKALSLWRPYSQLSSVVYWKANFSVSSTAKLGMMPGDKATV